MIKAYRRTSFRYDFIRENHEKEINFSFKFVSQEGKDKKKPHFKGLNLHFEFFNIKNTLFIRKSELRLPVIKTVIFRGYLIHYELDILFFYTVFLFIFA